MPSTHSEICEEHMETPRRPSARLRGPFAPAVPSPRWLKNIRVGILRSMTEIRSIASLSVPDATQIFHQTFSRARFEGRSKRPFNDATLPLTHASDGKHLATCASSPHSHEVRLRMVRPKSKPSPDRQSPPSAILAGDANKLVDLPKEKGGVITERRARHAPRPGFRNEREASNEGTVGLGYRAPEARGSRQI